MRRSINFVSFCSLPLLLLVISAIIIACDAEASAKNLGKKYENAVESGDLEEKFSLLGPRNLLKSHKVAASAFEDEIPANNTCGRDLVAMQEALVKQDLWALKMLDSSSKIPSGLLMGNMIDLGMYDECMAVRGENLGVEIRGRHCMYSITMTNTNVSLSINPTLSICVPASCDGSDIVNLFNSTINAIDKLKDLGVTIASATCVPIDPVVWDTEFIVCVSILVAFIGLLLLCTLCDVVLRRRDADGYRNPVISTLAQFSLLKSAASIFDTRTKQDNLPAIHGIRFLAMAWVVLGHEYNIHMMGVNVNNLDLFEWLQSWKSLYIFIDPFTVDTFFAISGFLMTYLFLKQMPKQRIFNIPMYYMHRYFRLTPAVIALTVFMIEFVPKIGSGPRWDGTFDVYTEKCRSTWWHTLLYVQNFFGYRNACLGHLWYLSVDMQLFWISPLILYPLYKNSKIGLAILVGLFLTSLIVPALVVGINKYPIMSFIHENNLTVEMEIFDEVYVKPYTRAGPWFVGIFLGYELANKNRSLSQIGVCIGWFLTIGAFAFCTFGTRSFMDPSYEYNVIWESFFAAVSRPIWAFGVCWIIYACIHNYAGPISSILSWKFFLPLSRISYCIYLVHIVIQLMHISAQRTPNYFSDYYMWHDSLSHLVISITVGFFFSLLFESPILILEKMLFRRKPSCQSESQKELRPEDYKEAKA